MPPGPDWPTAIEAIRRKVELAQRACIRFLEEEW